MTSQEAAIAIEILTAIPFFPSADGAQGMIANELAQLCPTPYDGIWLATRAAQLYSRWSDCGMPGLYQIWFSKHNPKTSRQHELDRMCGSTPTYPDGVPSERDLPALEGPKLKALPAGAAVSRDPQLDKLVVDLASNLAPELRTPEDLGREVKAAHPELTALDDKYVGLKVLAKERRDEKRVDAELRAMFHMEPK